MDPRTGSRGQIRKLGLGDLYRVQSRAWASRAHKPTYYVLLTLVLGVRVWGLRFRFCAQDLGCRILG